MSASQFDPNKILPEDAEPIGDIHEVKVPDDMKESQAFAIVRVSAEVIAERMRQHAKWGEQNWPDFPPEINPVRRPRAYGLPSELAAKARVEHGAVARNLTYGDILVEEVAEAFSTKTRAELRAELIQVAAVAQAWVEKLDREDANFTAPEEG